MPFILSQLGVIALGFAFLIALVGVKIVVTSFAALVALYLMADAGGALWTYLESFVDDLEASEDADEDETEEEFDPNQHEFDYAELGFTKKH